MAHALEASGADVTVASGAADALGKLQVTDIDVLLADIAMPETNGYALIRSVRALPDHRVASIPAVAVTAHARQCEQEEAFTAGFQSHLAKPLDPSELVRTVRNLL
jgi:CheY-like chemotaxis protein